MPLNSSYSAWNLVRHQYHTNCLPLTSKFHFIHQYECPHCYKPLNFLPDNLPATKCKQDRDVVHWNSMYLLPCEIRYFKFVYFITVPLTTLVPDLNMACWKQKRNWVWQVKLQLTKRHRLFFLFDIFFNVVWRSCQRQVFG